MAKKSRHTVTSFICCLLFLSHFRRSPWGTYSMINMMGSDRIQKPSMLRMFRCDPTSFMRSISWRNCRFSSSPAFSKQKRELMNKRISVKISQEKQYREGLWTAYPCKESDDEGHHVLNQNVNVTKQAKFAALARRITDNYAYCSSINGIQSK